MYEWQAPAFEVDAPSTRSWMNHVRWGLVLLVAWGIYSYTTSSTLGVAFACIRFGWNDFQTARWLGRFDPNRGRGSACFWFYLAFAASKVTITAFFVTLMIGVLFGKARVGGAQITSLLTSAAGMILLSILPLIGVLFARRAGVKVWVDSSVNASRLQNLWPPEASSRNSAEFLMGMSVLIPVLLTAIGLARISGRIAFFAAMAEIVLAWLLFRKVAAASPGECWGDDDFATDHAVASPSEPSG